MFFGILKTIRKLRKRVSHESSSNFHEDNDNSIKESIKGVLIEDLRQIYLQIQNLQNRRTTQKALSVCRNHKEFDHKLPPEIWNIINNELSPEQWILNIHYQNIKIPITLDFYPQHHDISCINKKIKTLITFTVEYNFNENVDQFADKYWIIL